MNLPHSDAIGRGEKVGLRHWQTACCFRGTNGPTWLSLNAHELTKLVIATSTNGHDFHQGYELSAAAFGLTSFAPFRISCDQLGHDEWLLSLHEPSAGAQRVYASTDLETWRPTAQITVGANPLTFVQGMRFEGDYFALQGGPCLRLWTRQGGSDWTKRDVTIDIAQTLAHWAGPKVQHFAIATAHLTERGLLLVVNGSDNRGHCLAVASLLLDQRSLRPTWHSESPTFDPRIHWQCDEQVKPLSTMVWAGRVFSYWEVNAEEVLAVIYAPERFPFAFEAPESRLLQKPPSNPMIAPLAHHAWEAMTCFNPAAFAAAGKIHLLYRAQGYDFISRIGYATSSDGETIDYRASLPIFTHVDSAPAWGLATGQQGCFASGGGIAGCEDPRVTIVDDRVVMTYVAFDGMSLPRLAITSIHLSDFLEHRWFWERPVLISPPGIVDKSGVVFPEKVRGKFVVMHRIFPNIQIDYVDDLLFDGSRWLRAQAEIEIRPGMWDSRKIGAGAPPIKTKDGWLLIYYGVDDRDDRTYKVGAMLLDIEEPSRVLHRTNAPILEPNEWFEVSGAKPGIAYPCGAVVLHDTLFVYYGAADNVVAVAKANLSSFLSALKAERPIALSQTEIRRIEVADGRAL